MSEKKVTKKSQGAKNGQSGTPVPTAKGTKKKKPTKENVPKRDEKGRFIPGESGNPNGRPKLSEDFEKYAKLAPSELWKIVQDEETGRTLKASILEWFAEMYYGKARQQVDVDAEQTINGGAMEVKFEGDIAKWAQ